MRTLCRFIIFNKFFSYIINYCKTKINNPTVRLGYMSFVYKSKLSKCNIIYDNAFLYNVTLGNYTYVGGYSRVQNAEIGRFCSIAPHVTIGVGRHPLYLRSTHPGFYATNQRFYGIKPEYDNPYPEYAKIEIGNDVWIGIHAIILDGVKIGDGAVIGAGSVVTKDVPPYAVVGGVPAKLIKYRFDEERRKELLNSSWWNEKKYD